MHGDMSRILEKIVPSRDAWDFWRIYKEIDLRQFAVIKIGGECVENSLERIADDLSDLYKLGLFPVVTFGWGKTLTDRLAAAGIESWPVNGDRYTDARVMVEVEKIAGENGRYILTALNERGVKARLIDHTQGTIVAEQNSKPGYGTHNGVVVDIRPDAMFNSIDEGFMPLVSPIGISADGKKSYNINSDTAAGMISRYVDPVKYISITASGGVRNQAGQIINEIVLKRDAEKLHSQGTLYGGMEKKVREAELSLSLRQNGDDRSVQIVGPGNLLRELFSYKGAGTYVRNGYVILRKNLEEMDMASLRGMVERKFGEELRDDSFGDGPRTAYVERNFKGTGIVYPDPLGIGIPYLDVIVVDNGFNSNGLGSDILSAIGAPKLFWRSRVDREANGWYFRISTGREVFDGADGHSYNYFWQGQFTRDEKEQGLRFVQRKKSNFKQPEISEPQHLLIT